MKNFLKILDALPHRYPFLMVDKVLEIVQGESIKTQKCVSINEPHFQGHFPDLPVMPGILLVEAMAQSGAILAYESNKFDLKTKCLYITSIQNAKFISPVYPGDVLNIEVVNQLHRRNIWKQKGKCVVINSQNTCAEAEFSAVLLPKHQEL